MWAMESGSALFQPVTWSAPSFNDRVRSGSTMAGSIFISTPRPVQVGHAP